MRCTIDFGSPGFQYGPRRGEITLEPVEEVTNGLVSAQRFLRRSEIFGEEARVAKVELWRKPQGQALLAGPMSGTTILPLIPMRSTAEQPFESLQVKDVRAIDGEHALVLCTGGQQGRNKRIDYVEKRNRRIMFWTKPVPPVVQRIEEHVERTSLEGPTRLLGRDEIHAILSDFKPCPGGMVARRVRYVEQSEGLRARRWKVEEPGVRMLEWSSEDLGDQPPTDADFMMSIPSDVRLVGLKQGLLPGTARRLDLSMIGRSDLEERHEADSTGNAVAGQDRHATGVLGRRGDRVRLRVGPSPVQPSHSQRHAVNWSGAGLHPERLIDDSGRPSSPMNTGRLSVVL